VTVTYNVTIYDDLPVLQEDSYKPLKLKQKKLGGKGLLRRVTLLLFSIPFCAVFPALLEVLRRILRVGMLLIRSIRTKPCLA